MHKLKKDLIFRVFCCISLALFLITESVFAISDKNIMISDFQIHTPVMVPETMEEEALAPDSFDFKFNGYEDYSAWGGYNGWKVNRTGGYYGVVSGSNLYHGDNLYLNNFGDDFVLEYAMQFRQQDGNTVGVSVNMGDRALLVRMRPHDFFVHTRTGTVYSDELDISNTTQWYNIKIESYDYKNRVRIYVDDQCVADVEPYPVSPEEGKYIHLYANGLDSGNNELRIDWLKLTPITYSKTISSVANQVVYKEGEEIEIQSFLKDGYSLPEVNYTINGKTVAVGYPPEYRAILANLPAGNYEVVPFYDSHSGKAVQLEILPSVSAEMEVKEIGTGISVSLKNCMDMSDVSEVEYLLDGISVGSAETMPYTMQIPNVTHEGHTVAARLKNDSNVIVKEFVSPWIPVAGNQSLNYSNEISYSVSGTSGKAKISYGNGNHLLSLEHTPHKVICVTNEGKESFPAGLGHFTILTDGPFADIYQNGQLIYSILLPYNETTGYTVEEGGLDVRDFSVSVPKNRRNYFLKRNFSTYNEVYSLPGLTKCNNIDFVIENNFDGEFALNDGYYLTRMKVQGNEIFAYTVFEEKSVPEWKKIGNLLPGTKNHYRAETTGGMIRLYGNGKWLASFRGIPSVGEPQLGVSVNAGEISYLSVNDYTDIYLYQDDFSQKGRFSTMDYWRLTNIDVSVDDEAGKLVLDGEDRENAIAELNAYVGETELSGKIRLEKCDGGFWFVLNHGLEEEYTKAGYNARTNCFEIVDVTGDESASVTKTLKEKDGFIPLDKDVIVSVSVRELNVGKEILLRLDGQEVLRHQETDINIPMTQRGKIGFVMSRCVAELAEVSYRGDAKPLLAVNDTEPIPYQINTLSVIENQDGLVLVNDSAYSYSMDGGISWTERSADPLQSSDVYELANGEYLSIKIKTGNKTSDGRTTMYFVAAISQDGGRSYSEVATVSGTGIDSVSGGQRLAITSTGGRVYQGESGRIYYVGCEEGNENYGVVRIYYSDDNGRSWKASQTVIDSRVVGATVHEAKCIELKDGHCRLFARSEIGSVIYLDSFDYGVTWDLTPHMLPMFSSANCFNVDQDREDRNVLYIGWGYDNANLGGLIQYPRTRWAIAKSDDWGENWEFIGTTMEYTRHEESFQNMNFNITDEYLVQNANAAAEPGDANIERYLTVGGRFIVLDREKQVSTKRFERLHLRFPSQLEEQSVVSAEQKRETLVVNTESGNLLFKNRLVTEGVYENAVLAEVAAALVGAKTEAMEDGGLRFSAGDSVVEFEPSMVTSYQGKKYLNVPIFVQMFNLYTTEQGNILVLGETDQWSKRALRAFQIGTNPLEKNLS